MPATSWVEAVICCVEAAISSAIAAASWACCLMVPTRSRSLPSIPNIVLVSGSFGARPGFVLHEGMPRSPSAIRSARLAATPVGDRICFTSTQMMICSSTTATARNSRTPRTNAGVSSGRSSQATRTTSTATTVSAVRCSL